MSITRYDVALVIVAKRVVWPASLKKPRFQSSESESSQDFLAT